MKSHVVIGGGGIRLHVDETGNPNGKAILLIHGLTQCRLAWRKQVSSDLANDFRLVAPDIRGHGLSDKPRDAYGDSRLWADDINALITTLGLDHPVLCGWSYGGVMICDYLRFYGETQIAGINFVNAVAELGEPLMPFVGPEYLPLVAGMCSNDAEASVQALAQFVRLCVHEEPSPEDLYFFLGYNTIVPPYVRDGLIHRTLTNDDVLGAIRKPVLITHGEQDAIVLLRASQQHAAVIRHAQTSFYPNVGHAPFWEDPTRFNRELRAFASSLK